MRFNPGFVLTPTGNSDGRRLRQSHRLFNSGPSHSLRKRLVRFRDLLDYWRLRYQIFYPRVLLASV